MKEKEAFYFVACSIIKNKDTESIVRMLNQLCDIRMELENLDQTAKNAEIYCKSGAKGSANMGAFGKGISYVTNKIKKIINNEDNK